MNEQPHDVSNEQLAELISAVKDVHGFDFSNYSKPSLKRRVSRVLMVKKLTFDKLQHTLLNVPAFLQEFVEEITVNVTEMFRDPSFYKALANEVVPQLSTYPRLNIWSAGCSTGEEAYSLAILMSAFGLGDRSFIYGTDVNTVVLANAGKGVYSARNMKIYTDNYQLCGFDGLLTDHFSPLRDGAAVNEAIKLHTRFSVHNLAADPIFNEFQIISCRNVFIYFETTLQEKILDLFYNSLAADGYLCLGSKETIRSEYFKRKFKTVNAKENIYQKTGSR